LCGIDRGNALAEFQIDVVLSVEIRRAKRDPFRRRVSGEVILGEVGLVVRKIAARIDQCEWSFVSFAAQCFRGALAGRPPPMMTTANGP
jgi:hypothetical protein